MGTLICGELKMGKEFCRPPGAVAHLEPDPDRNVLYTGTVTGAVSAWPMDRENQTYSAAEFTKGHAASGVTALSLMPNGVLLSGHRDGRVRLWSADSHVLQRTLEGHTAAVSGLAWHGPSASVFSSATDGALLRWSLEHARPGAPVAGAHPVSPHATGALAVLGDDLFYVAQPEPAHVIRAADVAAPGPDAPAAAPEAEGAAEGAEGAAEGPPPAAPKCLRGHADTVTSLRAGGDRLFSGSTDMTVRTWAGDGTGLSAFRGARKPVTAVAVTATRLYVASADLSIREFDLASQEPTNVFIHNEPIVALAVCGARLFVASEGGLVRVANVNRAASADDVAMARV